MDLWQLSVFCKVIELKSFSRAGRKIRLSQPTVSSHIKDLEDHFGCRLVDRLAKETIPTKAGELLYQHARKLIRLRDETETAMAAFSGQIKGRLEIGASTIPGGYIMPQWVGAFTRAFPDVRISMINGDTETIIREILEGSLELGVVGAKWTDRRIVQEKLADDEMRLVVPAGHPWADRKRVSLKMLMKEPFIIREPGSGTLKSIRKSLARKECYMDEFNIVAEMGSTEAVRQAVKHGVGVSIISEIAVSEDIASGAVKAMRVTGLNLRRAFYLTWHKHRSESPLRKAFIDFIKTDT
jgi:DNA-binding transcriptional LysR family regulator